MDSNPRGGPTLFDARSEGPPPSPGRVLLAKRGFWPIANAYKTKGIASGSFSEPRIPIFQYRRLGLWRNSGQNHSKSIKKRWGAPLEKWGAPPSRPVLLGISYVRPIEGGLPPPLGPGDFVEKSLGSIKAEQKQSKMRPRRLKIDTSFSHLGGAARAFL